MKTLIAVIILGVLMPSLFVSEQTYNTDWEIVETEILKQANRIQVEPALIKAIIMHESAGGFTNAYRCDYSALKRQSWYSNTLTADERNDKRNYSSYGLMQILYGLAKHYGYTGTREGLFSIEANLEYGCRHLSYLNKKYDNVKHVISAYNYGSVKVKNGKYANQKYVDLVYKKYKSYGGQF